MAGCSSRTSRRGGSSRGRSRSCASSSSGRPRSRTSTSGSSPTTSASRSRTSRPTACPDDPIAAYYDAQPGDRGFHLLIGPPELLGSGVAQALVRHLVTMLLGQYGIDRIVCEPDARNARMLTLCRALGGEELATLELPGPPRGCSSAGRAPPAGGGRGMSLRA